jgi:cellulose synthase/poly-beta-1,6-N-acetylglucosamine synthase-like glycosyltransferase
MMFAINALLLLVTIGLCVPVATFCVEVLLSLWPAKRRAVPELPDGANIAVLIPAHNEQAVIAATLKTLVPTLPAACRVLVVADNCSDETATVARASGAKVVERTSATQRGKGYALDFGIRHLSDSPPDAIVFLDADCQVSPDTVQMLGAVAITTQRPVQGLNLCDPDPNGSVLQLVSGLAFRFKNLVRTLGLVRLAGLNYLTGTGMALPWRLAGQAKLADGNVVEDMQLGIDFVLAGSRPLFLPEARVDSPLPQQRRVAQTQRTRWEHGHLKTLLQQVPRLAWLSIYHRRADLFCLAIDLAIPPLSLLVLTMAFATGLAGLGWLAGASSLPLGVLAAADAALAAMVLFGWWVHCRRQVPLWALLAAPLYATAKLPIYLAFVVKRQQHWVRTERDLTSAAAQARAPSRPPA